MYSRSEKPPRTASNFKSFSQSLEQFFLTVGQNNFGNKIPFLVDFLSCFKASKPRNSLIASPRKHR